MASPGPIRLTLQDRPPGIAMKPVTISGTQTMVRVGVYTTLAHRDGPYRLAIVGTASNEQQVLTRAAVPAEDRMQAFLWRHLMPVEELVAAVLPPSPPPPPKPAATPEKKPEAKPAVAAKS